MPTGSIRKAIGLLSIAFGILVFVMFFFIGLISLPIGILFWIVGVICTGGAFAIGTILYPEAGNDWEKAMAAQRQKTLAKKNAKKALP